jgi:hypothetical protein
MINIEKLLKISSVVAVLALVLMCINWFITPFSDSIARSIGIVLIISVVAIVYSTVKVKNSIH